MKEKGQMSNKYTADVFKFQYILISKVLLRHLKFIFHFFLLCSMEWTRKVRNFVFCVNTLCVCANCDVTMKNTRWKRSISIYLIRHNYAHVICNYSMTSHSAGFEHLIGRLIEGLQKRLNEGLSC